MQLPQFRGDLASEKFLPKLIQFFGFPFSVCHNNSLLRLVYNELTTKQQQNNNKTTTKTTATKQQQNISAHICQSPGSVR